MKVVVLYHPKSDHGGIVEDFAHDYQRSRNRKLELVSLETRDGAATASLYDVTRYPAILALANDGQVQNMWQGLPLPLMNELDQYTQEFDTALAQAQLLAGSV
jgi:hypothetical protein